MSESQLPSPLECLLEVILDALNDLVEFDLAVVLKLSDAQRLVVQKAVGPLAGDRFDHFEIDLRRRSDLARLLDRGQPYLFDESEDHHDTYEDVLDLPEGHSCMVAPLSLQDRPIGLLTLDHQVCGKYSPAIVKFIGTLSRLIAIIIDQNESGQYREEVMKTLTQERNVLLSSRDSRFRNLVGDSPAWNIVLEQIRTVAASDLPVLIHGETGTGKEQCAKAIHDLSSRSDQSFITLNCSALNASLAESELFGHEQGAFTSAETRRRGRFELADGGTLFLDEIGDLPPAIQPKILRTLQEGTFERVGGEKTLRCDVRVVAASNKNLVSEVSAGRFREDLYYRLGVFPIDLPPLRHRRDDIPSLAEYFLRNPQDQDTQRLTSDALDALMSHSWPGNIRELQNVMRRAALVAGDGPISVHHLGLDRAANRGDSGGSTWPDIKGTQPLATLEEVEAAHIRRALVACDGRVYGSRGAAQVLGMKPSTLQSRMKKLGVEKT